MNDEMQDYIWGRKDPRSFKIYRGRRGWPAWYQRFLEAWWIVRGKWSLHRAWQEGYDHGTRMEYHRVITNMGEIDAQRRNVAQADLNISRARGL